MNVVPSEFIRVMPGDMRAFVEALYRAVGMSADRAALMAKLLVNTDLRGVFSHGTRQSVGYLRLMRDGQVNPNPEVTVAREGPATAVLDGDGGMGHFACWQAAHVAVDKAREIGIGAAATRNHHHFGAAGKYSRVALDAGFVGYATSSHARRLGPDSPLLAASGSSPLSWAIPAGDEPPIVLDMGSSVYSWRADDFEGTFRKMPAAFFKALGLGAVCHALGGILAGLVTVDEAGRAWPGANQGALILAIDIARFADPATYRRQMDGFLSAVGDLQPFPGESRSVLPGRLEWERAREWSESGIPVGPEHRAALKQAAEACGVAPPF